MVTDSTNSALADGAPTFHRRQLKASQVADAIGERIASGTLSAGDRISSERELAVEFSVARSTARRALTALVGEGVVVASPGSGYFVSESDVFEPLRLVSFSKMAAARGLASSARVLVQRTRESTLEEAEQLRIAPGTELFELERLRLLDGIPVALSSSLVPTRFVPSVHDTDWSLASLYEVMSKSEVRPTSAEITTEALLATPEQSVLLSTGALSPILKLTQVTFQASRVIELGTTFYRGDRYRFRTIVRT